MRVEFALGKKAEWGMSSKCQFLSNRLDRTFNGLDSKRKIALLAVPKALAKVGVQCVLFPLALVVDRFVSVIETCRDSKTPVSLKARKCILLPVKLALTTPLLVLGIAVVPICAGINLGEALLALDTYNRDLQKHQADLEYKGLVTTHGQPA